MIRAKSSVELAWKQIIMLRKKNVGCRRGLLEATTTIDSEEKSRKVIGGGQLEVLFCCGLGAMTYHAILPTYVVIHKILFPHRL